MVIKMRAKFRNNFIKAGLKVSYYRKLKMLTQAELAEKMGCEISFIGAIEAPNIYKSFSLDTLFRISEILEVPAYKFLMFDED